MLGFLGLVQENTILMRLDTVERGMCINYIVNALITAEEHSNGLEEQGVLEN